MEYTNGWTEDMYERMTSGLQEPFDFEDPYQKERKRRSADYLAQRWQRENNIADDDLQAVSRSNRKSLANSNLSSNQLKLLQRQGATQRMMANRLLRNRAN